MTVVRNVGPGEAYQMSVGKEQRNGMDTMLCIVYNDLRNGMCVDSPTRRSYNEQQCEGRCYATSKERESDAKKSVIVVTTRMAVQRVIEGPEEAAPTTPRLQ